MLKTLVGPLSSKTPNHFLALSLSTFGHLGCFDACTRPPGCNNLYRANGRRGFGSQTAADRSGDPPKVLEKQTVGTVSISQNANPASTFGLSQCRHCREAFWAKARLVGDLRQSVPQNGRVHLFSVEIRILGLTCHPGSSCRDPLRVLSSYLPINRIPSECWKGVPTIRTPLPQNIPPLEGFFESQAKSQAISAVRSRFGHFSSQSASQPQPYRYRREIATYFPERIAAYKTA